MLASLPLVYLLVLAAAATSLFCFSMTKWIPGRKGRTVFPLVSAACCLGMILVGRIQYQHWPVQHMLILYSFAWVGLTIGLFPARKLMHKYATEINAGVKREKYDVPARYQVSAISSVIIGSLLGIILS
ncbi:hypothetical protein CP981_06595 [Streptomyces platensis]|uniref:Uncharacterized protein n=1 Tax=Streptomyces platensis TaxID=58346 RepID=A0AAE6NG87_STRPT|nr:hypothetical protein [Streptomyces platensis]OSY34837.1 hypothetical protein BG653_07351 [Streptomyces platensis]QEV51370.1 hypothetical protein CP981_06595 [Streptomyces platensis]